MPARGINRYLAPAERVLHLCRRHPVVLAKPLAIWLATLLFLGLVSFVLTQGDPIPLVDAAALWAGVAVTLYLAFQWVRWRRDRYAVTSERVLLLEGILSIKVSAVSLARVTETSFSRSLLGRIFGYGELRLDSPGEQLGLATLRYLPKPEALYRLITSLLLRLRETEAAQRAFDPSEENTGPLPPVVI